VGNDFEVADDIDSVRSSLAMIFGTRSSGPTNQGEIPFNQGLGTLLELIRHRNLDDPGTEQLADYYLVDAIRRNEPRAVIKEITYDKDHKTNKLEISVRYDVIARNVPGNRVIAKDVKQEFVV
jgi:phage baseplate assembly protein W